MKSKKANRKLSKFNIFMKTEIKRCKKMSPNMTHRAAFKMAAQNWKSHSGSASKPNASKPNASKPKGRRTRRK
jgi:hypothetical protein